MGTKPVPRSVLFTAVVAALVTVAALVGVASLRLRETTGHIEAAVPALPASPAGNECGNGPCRTVASQDVGGKPVDLLADAAGDNGRFSSGGEIVQTSITELGAQVGPGSLACVTATMSACLISAPLGSGRIGELMVDRGGDWRSVDKPVFSDAGVVVLGNVTGDDAPEVTVVESSPPMARVYALDGSEVGCSRTYSRVSQIRGWPAVHLLASDLRSCS